MSRRRRAAAPAVAAPSLARRPGAGRIAAALGAALLGLACASPAPDATYRPSESVLEVVAVLARHVNDDTYRFEPARDFSERNVYRASLLRLENLEKVHEADLRAGHMDDVVAFAKGRAFERLRAFELAAASYRRAAAAESALEAEARRGADLCESLARLTALPVERHDEQVAGLSALLEEAGPSHYGPVIREEIERADLLRARHLAARRRLDSGGAVIALAALQRLVIDHRESKKANRHMIELADLYAELAEEYVDEHPPESLGFDPPAFEELVTSAARLYEAVANQDGAVERVEAARRLEAFLAFTLRVDRDRFTP